MPNETEIESDKIPHLLVVDDSRLMRRAIGKILGKEYRITEAADGEKAWSILQETNDIQVIFSDLSMPNLDGFGLLKKIRNSDDPCICELPVIIITGAEDDDETKHKALNNGASDFISKPFESVQLRTRAKTHVCLDQTHKKLNETASELEKQATTDRLTGLSNKKYFDTRVVKDLSYAKRHRRELTIVILEINDFHHLFLTFGKEIADDILKNVARISHAGIRNEDTLARIGLAKLAFILPSVNRIGAKRLAERVCKKIKELNIQHEGNNIPFIANIGVAAIDINNSTSVEDIINLAENHLQLAITQPDHSIVIDDVQSEENDVISNDLPSQPDIETAIRLANSDEANRLEPYLIILLKKILPLLKLCNRTLKLGINEAINTIEERLKQ